jgi:glycosyltransferase involved in cell wall biosynthesis
MYAYMPLPIIADGGYNGRIKTEDVNQLKSMNVNNMKIMAGMPAYNESKYIGSMVLSTRQYVNEVVVVDDGSGDDTSKIAQFAGADVIRHPQNKGYGAAILSIFDEARKRDPDVLIILDADAQHNPQEIPNIIKPILEGYDVVIGTREKQAEKIPFYRRIGQKVIARSVNILSDEHLSDSECGFRAFSRKAIAELHLKESGMAISAETVAEAARQNLKIIQVPVSVIYGKDGSTLNPVSHGLGVMTRILVMISEQRPLLFFGLAGIILMLLGLAAGFFTLSLYTQSNVISVAWALIAIFLVILGAMSFFNGITLHAMNNVIHQALSKYKR